MVMLILAMDERVNILNISQMCLPSDGFYFLSCYV